MAVTCYGQGTGQFHIAPGGGFFGGSGMCCNSPVDAAQYPPCDRLYAYANIRGYSDPKIITRFPDGSEDVYSAGSGYDYCWIWWDWGGWTGDVVFELRDGGSVKATRNTNIGIPDPCEGVVCEPICEGLILFNMHCEGGVCVRGSMIEANSPQCGFVCAEGAERNPESCFDGSTIHHEKCVNNEWVATGETCPQPECQPGEVQTQECGKFPRITTHTCESGYWTPTDEQCDPCMGVVCPQVIECVGRDSYETQCVGGACVPVLREVNDPMCDPCTGVVCEPECFGYDLHETSCDEGVCVRGRLLEADSRDCGYDPCEGVICTPECVGHDLHETSCDEGVCVPGAIIEADTPDCGFVCHEGETRNPETCFDGTEIDNERCVNNEWVPSGEACPIDPCAGVVCDPACVGTHLYETSCVDGVCVPGAVIEPHSPGCGYVPPEPEDVTSYLAIGVAVVAAYLMFRRK